MTEGKITITTTQKTTPDQGFRVDGAVLIRFMNFGQNYISLDDGNVVIEPGEAYIEGDLKGPGLDHTYTINFITNPGTPPAIDDIKVKALNFLQLRISKRKGHARK